MGMKRKLADDAFVHSQCAKQMRLVPFPSFEPSFDMDLDIPMSDEQNMHLIMPSGFHSRLASSASTDSDCSSVSEAPSTPAYPVFDLYPAPDAASHAASVDGRTFSGLGFPHLSSGCKQLPKLRVACGSGPTGQRSMWGLCEECGAIQMLDS
ncbi:hypothetical protein ACEPAG_8089 [Sanghuangporus baumii]